MNDSLLDCLLGPLAESLTGSQAKDIVNWKLTPDQESRISYLRERANKGVATEDEDREYKRFVEELDVISILQARARKVVDKTAA